MSRGLGRVQRALLAILRAEEEDYQRDGNRGVPVLDHRHRRAPLLDTIDLAARVYRVERPQDGEWIVDNAKVVAVQRALAGLMKKGLVGRRRGFNDGRAHWGTPSAIDQHDRDRAQAWEETAWFRAIKS
jgi:hypothetical protein